VHDRRLGAVGGFRVARVLVTAVLAAVGGLVRWLGAVGEGLDRPW
jgi:hypothetical protein